MWGGLAERQMDNEAGQEQEACSGSRQTPSHPGEGSGDQLSPVPSYSC